MRSDTNRFTRSTARWAPRTDANGNTVAGAWPTVTFTAFTPRRDAHRTARRHRCPTLLFVWFAGSTSQPRTRSYSLAAATYPSPDQLTPILLRAAPPHTVPHGRYAGMFHMDRKAQEKFPMQHKRLAGLVITLATLCALGRGSQAQTAKEWVDKGNTAYEARNATEALNDYEQALALDPKNYQALWRAARTQVELGEFDRDANRRTSLYKAAEANARLATEAEPNDAWGHFVLAMALGRNALTLGTRDRIKYAGVIRDQALTCLKLQPTHAGCLHVMGVWNAEVMRLSGFSRMFARTFLGGKVFDAASWSDAQKFLIEAIRNDPRRIVHRLDLARVYRDRDNPTQAKTQYQLAIDGELVDYNDPHYKDQARTELKKL